MATDKPKVLLILDEDLLKRIDDYRYENRIPARTEAIRRLIDNSLSLYEKKKGFQLKFVLLSIEYSKSIFESVDITEFSAKLVPSFFKTALTVGYWISFYIAA